MGLGRNSRGEGEAIGAPEGSAVDSAVLAQSRAARETPGAVGSPSPLGRSILVALIGLIVFVDLEFAAIWIWMNDGHFGGWFLVDHGRGGVNLRPGLWRWLGVLR